MNGPKTGAGVRAAACAPGSVEAGETRTPPPLSDTGVEITDKISLHWLAGSFDQPFENIADLVHSLTDGADFFPLTHGKYGYKSAYTSLGGLLVLTDPGSSEMPTVHVSVPGRACEVLGLEKLRILFCNATNLTRVDIAFDGYEETPGQLAQWIEVGNVRTRAKRESCEFTRNLGGGGNRLYIGSINSTWSLCAYDKRGFTRLELRMKGDRARLFQPLLLDNINKLSQIAVGLLREFVDFIDSSSESNPSRAPLLPSWSKFTQDLQRVKMKLQGAPAITEEGVVKWIEYQVAATLALYHKLGYSVEQLLQIGQRRMRKRHLAVLVTSGISIHQNYRC